MRKNISPLVVPPPAAPAAGAKDAGPSAVPKGERLVVAKNLGDT